MTCMMLEIKIPMSKFILCFISFSIMACSLSKSISQRKGYNRETGSWDLSSNHQAKQSTNTKASTKQSQAPTIVPTSGSFRGHISYYGPGFDGKQTASGEIYDQMDMTCAHKKLPFGTKLKITLIATGRSVEVRVNDRGPYIKGRLVDVSVAAARELGLEKLGVGEAQIEIIK